MGLRNTFLHLEQIKAEIWREKERQNICPEKKVLREVDIVLPFYLINV